MARRIASASPESWRRVAAAVRTVENDGRQPSPFAPEASAGDDSEAVLCRTSNAWAKGTSAELYIWTGQPGLEVNTGCTLTAYNHYANIAAAKWVTVMLHRHGYYYAIAAECA